MIDVYRGFAYSYDGILSPRHGVFVTNHPPPPRHIPDTLARTIKRK